MVSGSVIYRAGEVCRKCICTTKIYVSKIHIIRKIHVIRKTHNIKNMHIIRKIHNKSLATEWQKFGFE